MAPQQDLQKMVHESGGTIMGNPVAGKTHYAIAGSINQVCDMVMHASVVMHSECLTQQM